MPTVEVLCSKVFWIKPLGTSSYIYIERNQTFTEKPKKEKSKAKKANGKKHCSKNNKKPSGPSKLKTVVTKKINHSSTSIRVKSSNAAGSISKK